MKPGTLVKLPDGREGTVVYHGLDGYGIIWGRVEVDVDAILSHHFLSDEPTDYCPAPEAMLRKQTDLSAKLWPGMECVGDDYEVVQTYSVLK